MTDPEILRAAIKSARMTTGEFAVGVLAIEPVRLEPFLTGERPLYKAVRALCTMIIERPAIAQELAQDRRPSEKL